MKLRVPERFMLLGREWTVSRPDVVHLDEDTESEAACRKMTREIEIRSDLVGDAALEDFLHEGLHGCWPGGFVSEANENRMISALEMGVLDLVRALVVEDS